MRAVLRRLPLALIVGSALVLAAAHPAQALTREQADAIAKRILDPHAYANAVLYTLPEPILVRTTVDENDVEASLDPSWQKLSPVIDLRTKSVWFYWEDLERGADFPHPSRLLLLDTATGAVLADRKMDWQPLVKGRYPPFISQGQNTPESRSTEESRYVVASSQPLVTPHPHPVTTQSVIPPEFMRDDCLVTIGDRTSYRAFGNVEFRGSFQDFSDWAAHVGMRSLAMPPDSGGDELVAKVHMLVALQRPCHNILIFLAGHGAPPPGYADPSEAHARTTPEPTVRTAVDFRPDPHDPNGLDIREKFVTAPDFERLLEANPQTTFEIAIDSCFSGRYAPVLFAWEKAHGLHNLRLVASAASATESEAAVYSGLAVVPATGETTANWWAVGRVAEFFGAPHAVPDPEQPREDPPESTWVHAFVDLLYNWSDNASAFFENVGSRKEPREGFVNELISAAGYAKTHDFAATLRLNHPEYSDDFDRVLYRYDVKMTVSGRMSWSNPGSPIPESGSGTSSWELDWENAAIGVDPEDRALVWALDSTRFGPPTSTGGPETYQASGGTVNASFSGQSGQPPATLACGYSLAGSVADLTRQGDLFTLQAEAGDDFLPASTPHAYGGYQYTGTLLLEPVVPGGLPSEPGRCPMPGAGNNFRGWAPPDNGVIGTGFLGSDGTPESCTPLQPLIAVPVWKLGEPKPITLEGKLAAASTCSGEPKVTASGTYKVVLTPRIPHRIG